MESLTERRSRAGALRADEAPTGPPQGSADLERLAHTIETQVVPRLLMAHRAPRPAEDVSLDAGATHVVHFATLVLAVDPTAVRRHVEQLLDDGVALSSVFLDLFAPTARHLGRLWDEDRCDFASVTLGLWRLQELMRDLAPAHMSFQGNAPARRVLLASLAGSQHTLGLAMVAEFFREAGWQVCCEPSPAAGELAALVREQWFDAVGLSLGVSAQVEEMASVILDLRRHARNPALMVMVGGPVVNAHPGLAEEVGADVTAADAASAVACAGQWVAARRSIC